MSRRIDPLEAAERIRPRKLKLDPSNITVNPDLVFNDGLAVGDVKYKIASPDWSRNDLYQNIAFATAFGATRGCVIGFSTGGAMPPEVTVGDLQVRFIGWRTADQSPTESAARLSDEVTKWLLGFDRPIGIQLLGTP